MTRRPPEALNSPQLADLFAALRFEVLLYALQSPINIGMILRVAETYRFSVTIFDRHGVLDNPENFATIEDFACGAVSRRGFRRIADEGALVELRQGRRLIATSIESDGVALPDYCFRRNDLFTLGNEYEGLPGDFVAAADAVLQVPMPWVWTPKPKTRNPIDPGRTAPVARNGEPNLNVAMTAAIICYSAFARWHADASMVG
jgi:tRNA G18 (ribose-2'-O)-methylase SpoU